MYVLILMIFITGYNDEPAIINQIFQNQQACKQAGLQARQTAKKIDSVEFVCIDASK